MPRKILYLIWICMIPVIAQAQKKQSEIDSLNTQIKHCIEELSTKSTVLDRDFNMYDWAKEFQGYCGEVLYKHKTDVLSEIADQHEIVVALLALKGNCEVLQKFEKELNQINKIFSKKLSDQSKESTNKQLSFQEHRVVEFTVSDTRKIKAYVNSIVNRMKGDNSILRIFR